MNIFKILASYDGSIKEPNISSFLAFLLDPNEDHGITDLLLTNIISDFRNINESYFEKINIRNLSQYTVAINPEYSVFLNNKKRRDIDIVIEIYSDNKDIPLYTLCIENKITDSSIQYGDNQLQDELFGLQKEYEENGWNTEIYFCFLTLEDSKKSNEEFSKFDYDKKLHLFWKNENSIQSKLLKILDQERIGEIDPISEDAKFLIKSFIAFIRNDFKSEIEEKTEKQERQNYGKTVIEYFRDVQNEMSLGVDYQINDIRKQITEQIKKNSGIEPNPKTINCHFYATIVNEKNRIHYNVTEKNCDGKNLFYYPDVAKKNIIRKYSNDMENIEVFVKD